MSEAVGGQTLQGLTPACDRITAVFTGYNTVNAAITE